MDFQGKQALALLFPLSNIESSFRDLKETIAHGVELTPRSVQDPPEKPLDCLVEPRSNVWT